MIYTAIDTFYLTDEQLQNSPSRKDGIDEATETTLRIYGCDLIQESGILLRLPQAVMATGQVLFHRFYCKKSFARFNVKKVAASCVWLASKLEESPRKARQVIIVFHRMECRRENLPIEHLDLYSKKYVDLKMELSRTERHILKEMGFICHVEHPHKFISNYLATLETPPELRQEAWNLANDSLRTTLCVRFKSEVVACGVVYAAARRFQVPLPENPPWWKAFDAEKSGIDEVCRVLAHLYSLPKAQYTPVSKDGDSFTFSNKSIESKSQSTPKDVPQSSPLGDADTAVPKGATGEADIESVGVALVKQIDKPRESKKSDDESKSAATDGGARDELTLKSKSDRKMEASGDIRRDRDRDRDRERDRDRDRDRDRERERERERERDRARDRDREAERRNREREREEESRARERARLEKLAEREREKELESIKEQYLGSKKPKKRVIKPSEKFRFSFDWENTEDTSRDMNSLYQNPHEAQLLFGRGFRAGMDRREQKKLAAKNEKEMREQIRRKDGVEEKPEEADAQRRKEAAADLYDTFDMRVDRHWSEKKLEEMTERDWRIFREDYNISYKGSKIPRPMRSWVESKLSNELLKAVEKAGYKTPSPIQMAAIPLGLQQRDVIGIAETGSGKTAAFVLPMLSYITRLPPMSEENEAEGPYAVVMAPTRELAQQIEDETVKFAQYLGIKVVSIVGGQSIEEQGFKIRQGCEIVIATPGRLIDCLERRYAVLNQCNYVVLDEADRMIDMGFEPQVMGVLDAMPSSNLKPENEDEELDEKKIYRTTYMFSATMPPAVERLARKYLRNPVVVTIGTAGKATDLISQHVIMMKESEKFHKLQRLLDELNDKTAIVFVNTKKNADMVAKNLDKEGYRVTTLHGGKSQEQREISLEGFRTKRYNVLVATDVAGRGIDIPDVAHVINYDMPGNIEMYTHRIGRTGRAGKTGVATTFLTLQDTDVFYDLKQMLIQSNSPVPPELARHEASKFKPGTIPDRPPRRNDTVFAH